MPTLTRRVTTIAIAAATALAAVAVAAPSAADTDRTQVAFACPDTQVPATTFSDVDTTGPHGTTIGCLQWWEVTSGYSDGTYRPSGTVTRGQMATFITNLMGAYADGIDGLDLPTPAPNGTFADVPADHPHRDGILTVAAAGVAQGVGSDQFAPQRDVTRAQMATFIANVDLWATGADLRTTATQFDDVPSGNVHAQAVNGLAVVGIVQGVSDRTYRPSNAVTRAQMSAFLMRHADLMVDTTGLTHPGDDGSATPPPANGDDPGNGDDTTPPADDGDDTPPPADDGDDTPPPADDGDDTPPPADDPDDPAVGFGALEVTFCDVGQSDAAIVDLDGHTMLVDAGNFRGTAALDCLTDTGIDTLEVMVLTHPHADHIGQAVAILDRYDVDEVWNTDFATTSQTYANYAERIDRGVADGEFTLTRPAAGDTLTTGGFTVEFVAPTTDAANNVHDAGNLAFRITADIDGHGPATILFTGDAEQPAEARMVERYADLLDADVYQMGHHGSSTSTTQGLVDAGQFDYAIYSASATNSFGHPADTVVRRLRNAGVEVYGTAEHGTVTMTANSAGWQVSTQTGAPPTTSGQPAS